MIINGQRLLELAPIKDMVGEKIRGPETSYGLGEAGYDIRLKQDILFSGDGLMWVDGEFSPGAFTIASAIEEFQMPSTLVGFVKDKSTWAREGLSVFNTVIEPGWHGFLTLELVHHGRKGLRLPAGCGIAQVIFEEVAEPSAYGGKYQAQPDRPVGAIRG